MIEAIQSALDRVENSGTWTNPRGLVSQALTLAGIPAEKTIEGCNQTVAIVGPYAIKCGQASEVANALRIAEKIGKDFAKVHAHGRCWIIQERVEHCERDAAFSSRLRKLKVYDTRGNTGRRTDGSLCIFDGCLKG